MSRADLKIPVARGRGHRRLRYLIIFVGWALAVNAFVGEKGLSAMIQARRQYRSLDASLALARTENARLREEARRLREDPATIEVLARRDLGLIRPGEKVFIVVDAAAFGQR